MSLEKHTQEVKGSHQPVVTPPPHGKASRGLQSTLPLTKRLGYGFAAAVWTVGAFFAAQGALLAISWIVLKTGVTLPFSLDTTVLQTVVSVLVYALAIAIAVGAPWLVLHHKVTWKEVGLEQSLPRWRDIGLAPIAFILALVGTGIAMYVVSLVLPGVDMTTEQQVGFENLTQRYEMLLAFFTLVVLAPLCEEFLFRGYFYGKVRKYFTATWTIVLTSVVFGMMHLYAGPGFPLQWNVMISTAVLALFIGGLREYTGSIWAGILVHMLKNGVAFFMLFVAPLLGISLIQ